MLKMAREALELNVCFSLLRVLFFVNQFSYASSALSSSSYCSCRRSDCFYLPNTKSVNSIVTLSIVLVCDG